jgi:transcriptional regulator GlxA family with amidase domain
MKPISPIPFTATPRRLHVDLLVHPDSMLGLTLAMVDLLRLANTLAQLQGGPKAQPVSWQLLDAQAKPVSSADPLLGPYCCRRPVPAATDTSALRACFVPPLFAPSVPTLRAAVRRLAALRGHVAHCLQRGDTVVGLSNGLWLFAGTPGMQGNPPKLS